MIDQEQQKDLKNHLSIPKSNLNINLLLNPLPKNKNPNNNHKRTRMSQLKGQVASPLQEVKSVLLLLPTKVVFTISRSL